MNWRNQWKKPKIPSIKSKQRIHHPTYAFVFLFTSRIDCIWDRNILPQSKNALRHLQTSLKVHIRYILKFNGFNITKPQRCEEEVVFPSQQDSAGRLGSVFCYGGLLGWARWWILRIAAIASRKYRPINFIVLYLNLNEKGGVVSDAEGASEANPYIAINICGKEPKLGEGSKRAHIL